MNTQELNVLIDACCHNDRVAQETLYKHFYADMFRTCQRYTDDPHQALTILNDAFLKLFRSIAQYEKNTGNFKSWLKTIVINTAIDYVRRVKREIHVIHIDQVQEQGGDDFQINYNWNQEEVLQHFNQLPKMTRVVVNLFVFDDHSHKDIAALLDISETTSRWHLAEARKRLKASMQLKQSKLVRHD